MLRICLFIVPSHSFAQELVFSHTTSCRCFNIASHVRRLAADCAVDTVVLTVLLIVALAGASLLCVLPQVRATFCAYAYTLARALALVLALALTFSRRRFTALCVACARPTLMRAAGSHLLSFFPPPLPFPLSFARPRVNARARARITPLET